jgi:aerobic carbon-monoxide dehydrogenase large subunit
VFEDGRFRIVGTDLSVALGTVARRLGQGNAPTMLSGAGFWKPLGPTFPNGCHVAEVEIDPETGAWRLAAYSMLHDFGRVVRTQRYCRGSYRAGSPRDTAKPPVSAWCTTPPPASS